MYNVQFINNQKAFPIKVSGRLFYFLFYNLFIIHCTLYIVHYTLYIVH